MLGCADARVAMPRARTMIRSTHMRELYCVVPIAHLAEKRANRISDRDPL